MHLYCLFIESSHVFSVKYRCILSQMLIKDLFSLYFLKIFIWEILSFGITMLTVERNLNFALHSEIPKKDLIKGTEIFLKSNWSL